MDKSHWTQDLFPPTFHLTRAEVDSSAKTKKETLDTSPQTRIQAIYKKVKKEYDEEVWNARQKGTQVGDSLKDFREAKKTVHKINCLEKGCDKSCQENLSIADSELWDSREIEILREVFLKSRTENMKLKIELQSVKEEIKKVSEILKCKEEDYNETDEKFKKSQRAFHNLQLENKLLKKEMKVLDRRNKSLQEELLAIKDTNNKLRKEKTHERRHFLKEQTLRRDVEVALNKVLIQTRTKDRAEVETLKINYELQLKKLNESLTEAKEELEKEKEDHEQTRKALDHLRYHFASLPSKPNITTSSPNDDILSSLQIF
ncbi:hypothetical protein HOLleu_27939 [Holothuria leucospilota]|uniref:Uncharacterized protein n=1 Tax=Holothuria leucospilota TaxID=206669 RepID=A0A9Q1BQZ5_HOLLE|nr:hypothetical protein HOLleu_27939 [Holothuria leucospilota]